MGNDVIIWDLPKTLQVGIEKNAFIALTDAAGQFYGDYLIKVRNLNEDLKLNAGLIGLPPKVTLDPIEVIHSLPKDFFHSEQGFTAQKYSIKINLMNSSPVFKHCIF